MPWRECTDVEAMECLEAGGKVEVDCACGWQPLAWSAELSCFTRAHGALLTHRPGRKFRVWEDDPPEPEPTPLYKVMVEILERYSDDELTEWAQEHWPGLTEVLGAMAPTEPERAVPDGCERWAADGRGHFVWPDDAEFFDLWPSGTLYFEFLCPDGVWRTRNAPTAWWGARCLSGGPSIGEGQWLTADAAIVRTV